MTTVLLNLTDKNNEGQIQQNNKQHNRPVNFTEVPRGVNLNYRSRAVAKGLLRAIFCDKLF